MERLYSLYWQVRTSKVVRQLLREERGSEIVEKLLWIFAGALIVIVVAAGYSGSLKTLWGKINTAISGVTQAN